MQDTDLLICEATYGENEQEALAKEHGHMTFAQAAHLAQAAQVHELWLTHYSPMITDPQEYLKNAACHFEQTFCGADGMVKVLRFDKNPNIREKSVI
jgi:ribonuclease Z